jgi:hypothetical protein
MICRKRQTTSPVFYNLTDASLDGEVPAVRYRYMGTILTGYIGNEPKSRLIDNSLIEGVIFTTP